MMADEQEKKCEEGLPPWMATFADMMALLMCFFVLLLSFAEMDAIRFKKMADSMKDAFGVQREVPANEIVKGVSVIKLEFTASIADPTIKSEIKQETTEVEKTYLDTNDGALTQGLDQKNVDIGKAPIINDDPQDESLTDPAEESEEKPKEEPKEHPKEELKEFNINKALMDAVAAKRAAEAAEQAAELKEELKKEIEEGLISIETVDTNVIIRIHEKGSFPSGSAELNPGFIDVMERITVAISTQPGKIVVAGHTDNVPIATQRFRSNWELSSARAVTVVHALLSDPTMDPERFLVEGHADSDPLFPNNTAENRAINRRVELVIKRPENDRFAEELDAVASDEIEVEVVDLESKNTPNKTAPSQKTENAAVVKPKKPVTGLDAKVKVPTPKVVDDAKAKISGSGLLENAKEKGSDSKLPNSDKAEGSGSKLPDNAKIEGLNSGLPDNIKAEGPVIDKAKVKGPRSGLLDDAGAINLDSGLLDDTKIEDSGSGLLDETQTETSNIEVLEDAKAEALAPNLESDMGDFREKANDLKGLIDDAGVLENE